MSGDNPIQQGLTNLMPGTGNQEHFTAIETLSERLTGEPDPPYVTDADVFEGMAKQQMAGVVAAIDTTRISDLSRGYAALAEQVNITWGLVNLLRVTTAGWQGDSGNAAAEAVEKLLKPASESSTALSAINVRLLLAADVAGEVKPVVESLTTEISAPLPLSASVLSANETRREQERVEAARVLETIYKTNLVDVGGKVPGLTAPEQIPGSGTGSGSGIVGGGRGGAHVGVGEPDGADTEFADGPGTGGAADFASTHADDARSTSTPLAADNGPAATHAASATTTPSGGAGIGVAPGFTGGADRSSVGGGFVPSGPGAPGGALPPAVGTPAAASAVGAAGRGGVPGSMPIGAGGAGTKREEDKVHKTAAYLVNSENGKKLLGDPPKVSPSVFGA